MKFKWRDTVLEATPVQGDAFQIHHLGVARYLVSGEHTSTLGRALRDDKGVWVHWAGSTYFLETVLVGARRREKDGGHGGRDILAPMPGKLLSLAVSVGDEVKKGEALAVLEAMKMEHRLLAPRDGRVEAIHAKVGEIVEGGKCLLEIAAEEKP